MSDEQSIRDETAVFFRRVNPIIHEPLATKVAEEWADLFLDSPVIRRIQAEALRDHAKVVAHWERGHSPRILSHSVERIVADLNDRADRIEQGVGA
jgi:hypothetical protein